MKKIIPINHGNRLMKTLTQLFPSSFVESKYLPSIGGDVLKYQGKTCTLVDQCLPVLRCTVPCYNGTIDSSKEMKKLWDKYYTVAPQRQRQLVEQSKIVKRV